jgi:hypothetical protein
MKKSYVRNNYERRIARDQIEAETLQLSGKGPKQLIALASAASFPFVSFPY